MCCMLSTFHVSSWIVANISESSLLFSQYRFRPCWGVVNKYLYFFFGRVELWFGQVQMPYHSSEGRVHPKFRFYHCDLSQRTRNAIITSFSNLTLFWRKWHYFCRVSAEMLLINTYWYEKPRANIPSKGISITELWIPIINSWIHIIHDNRE